MSESSEIKTPPNGQAGLQTRMETSELGFWLVLLLLATPGTAMIFAMEDFSWPAVMAIIIGGATCNGFALAKIIAKKRWTFWVIGAVLSLFFAGCYWFLLAYCLSHSMRHGC